jgi:hypothetical protein
MRKESFDVAIPNISLLSLMGHSFKSFKKNYQLRVFL